MAKPKLSSLLKPTVETPFHIDFDWWQKNDQAWHVHLQSSLCQEHQEAYADFIGEQKVDWVDPETAEVQRVGGLQHVLITHCAKEDDFITAQTSLTEAIFRLFLANGNQQMSANDLADSLGKSPTVILRTISGRRVYKGIRPFSQKR
ncbi:MAG: hypothetical protein B6I38_04975 [Anaerolineaceae bacterium 4572_5.1]|nr:MAG: hypothetical protein B6I38_04975 [Anaerolineaceae bacterium 4572_5.1]